MGMAKAAELNGYPGPVHVPTLTRELDLTSKQRERVRAIYDRMSAAAIPLGAELVEHERVLDRSFAKREITPDRLGAETAAIGELAGRLRLVHLAAHLETRALLRSLATSSFADMAGRPPRCTIITASRQSSRRARRRVNSPKGASDAHRLQRRGRRRGQ
jgi:hypothetical protein